MATTGITFAALFSAAYIAKRWGTVSKYTSVATGTRPLDARSIRKNYSFEELLKAANEVLSSPTATRALPSLPRSLATLPCLHGDQTLLTRLISDGNSGSGGGNGDSSVDNAPLTAVTSSQPSTIHSLLVNIALPFSHCHSSTLLSFIHFLLFSLHGLLHLTPQHQPCNPVLSFCVCFLGGILASHRPSVCPSSLHASSTAKNLP